MITSKSFDGCDLWGYWGHGDNDPFEEASPESWMVSSCCGAPAIGELSEDPTYKLIGICSNCNILSPFEKDTSDEHKH